jgi:hypothetical protein
MKGSKRPLIDIDQCDRYSDFLGENSWGITYCGKKYLYKKSKSKKANRLP